MTARRKPYAEPSPTRLYSWRADRKASRECIRYFIRLAMRDKIWALQCTPEWDDRASDMSRDMRDKYRSQSLHAMARGSLEYCRLRAFMKGAYPGWPGDRPAWLRWTKLNPGVTA